jgi:hypothetical protein
VRNGTAQGDVVVVPPGAPRIVVIPPQDRDLKNLIDRLAFFVAKMGERFEKVEPSFLYAPLLRPVILPIPCSLLFSLCTTRGSN